MVHIRDRRKRSSHKTTSKPATRRSVTSKSATSKSVTSKPATSRSTTWASKMKDHARPLIERPLYNALNVLIQHRDSMRREVVADRLQIIPEAASERLRELKKLGLAKCEGKSWLATPEARELFPRMRVA